MTFMEAVEAMAAGKTVCRGGMPDERLRRVFAWTMVPHPRPHPDLPDQRVIRLAPCPPDYPQAGTEPLDLTLEIFRATDWEVIE